MELDVTIGFNLEDIRKLIEEECTRGGYTVLDIENTAEGFAAKVRPMTPEEREAAFDDARLPLQKVQDTILSECDEIKSLIRGTQRDTSRVVEDEDRRTPSTHTASDAVDDLPDDMLTPRQKRLKEMREFEKENEAAEDPYAGRRDENGFVIA